MSIQNEVDHKYVNGGDLQSSSAKKNKNSADIWKNYLKMEESAKNVTFPQGVSLIDPFASLLDQHYRLRCRVLLARQPRWMEAN